ncbi:hypothetical protein M1D58_27395 (plasmid) [Pseudomonas sp. R4-76]|uniref:hypothetical protein n=1 Tax=unclassified Pseudomonas TaxID=196821 RepID=UPI003DA8B3A8
MSMKKQISKKPLYIIAVTTVAMLMMLVFLGWVALARKAEEQSKPWDFRTFDRPIVAGAPGCEIRSPQGELMNETFKDAKPNTLTLEKGTSFTIDCFPIQQSEKSGKLR